MLTQTLINRGIHLGISLIVQYCTIIDILKCTRTTCDYCLCSFLIFSLRLLSNPAVPVMKAGTSEEDRHRALALARVRALIQFYSENQVVVVIIIFMVRLYVLECRKVIKALPSVTQSCNNSIGHAI